ncbi:GNAT family N-acetyltransferase [Microbulbifer spongiae]|uniref:GNAT family N-acetyltransferase n=1 Tax=Microbulbifer spongiae TaxID=2944933 RepID=UPI00345EE237
MAPWQKRLGDLPQNFFGLVAVNGGEVAGQIGMEVFSNPRRKQLSNRSMAVSEEHQSCGIGSKLLGAMRNLA